MCIRDRENRSPLDAARERRAARVAAASATAEAAAVERLRAARAGDAVDPKARSGRWAPPANSSEAPRLSRALPAALSNRVEDRLHRDSVMRQARHAAMRSEAIRGEDMAIRARSATTNRPARVGAFSSAKLSHTSSLDAGDRLYRLGMRDIAARRERCLLYTSPSPRDLSTSRMPSSA